MGRNGIRSARAMVFRVFLSDFLQHSGCSYACPLEAWSQARICEEITHQIFKALNSTFVTPLDREDIADLSSRLDDFVDAIEEATRRIRLYRIDQPTEHARRLARIIDQQAALIASTVPLLENRQQ